MTPAPHGKEPPTMTDPTQTPTPAPAPDREGRARKWPWWPVGALAALGLLLLAFENRLAISGEFLWPLALLALCGGMHFLMHRGHGGHGGHRHGASGERAAKTPDDRG